MKTFYFLLVILPFAFLFLNLSQAHAQTHQSLTIMPAYKDHSLEKGGTDQGIIMLVNQGDMPLTVSLSVKDFIVDNPDGIPRILNEPILSNRFSASRWIALVPQTLTLPPKEIKEVEYFVKAPQDAASRGHYAAIIASPEISEHASISGSIVQTNLASLLSFTVTGTIQERASANLFAKKLFEYGPVAVSAQINNQGDIHIKPIGNISINDIFGRNIDQKPLAELNIFPEASRKYQASLGKKYMFGPYKLVLEARYGKSGKITSTSYVWVIPWKETIVTILTIVVLILTVMLVRKRHFNTQQTTSDATSSSKA